MSITILFSEAWIPTKSLLRRLNFHLGVVGANKASSQQNCAFSYMDFSFQLLSSNILQHCKNSIGKRQIWWSGLCPAQQMYRMDLWGQDGNQENHRFLPQQTGSVGCSTAGPSCAAIWLLCFRLEIQTASSSSHVQPEGRFHLVPFPRLSGSLLQLWERRS